MSRRMTDDIGTQSRLPAPEPRAPEPLVTGPELADVFNEDEPPVSAWRKLAAYINTKVAASAPPAAEPPALCQHLETRYILGNTYCYFCEKWLHAGVAPDEREARAETPPNPKDCSCEHIHASDPTCHSKAPSHGAIPEERRIYPAGAGGDAEEIACWKIEYVDLSTGKTYTTVFSGPNAKNRARNYALTHYCEYKLESLGPEKEKG